MFTCVCDRQIDDRYTDRKAVDRQTDRQTTGVCVYFRYSVTILNTKIISSKM